MKKFIPATLLFMLAVLTSCSKDKGLNNGKVLYKDSPTWIIDYNDWRYISNKNDTLVELTGDTLLTGSFKFDKENEGFFAFQFSPTNLTGSAINFPGLLFTWYIKEEMIHIVGEFKINGSNLLPINYRTYSFTGRMSDDLSLIFLEGYFHEEDLSVEPIEHYSLFMSLSAKKQ